ncbi:hypothetical protein [Oryzomonas rubra]|uniref:Uncharacterized protein n=1 Tax=Oryzomonas rubra TaxID=2509454 RepID=A0A5A9XMU8_9BACT|nr:hypothetical protein [Oryzomonas rubra]KAA0894254.1 hypothetical protein ET418_04685 [Oryzomonas rubra]
MPIWKTEPIDREPEIVLTDWTVYEVSSNLWPGRTRHFVGFSVMGREGRVSSAIVQFDADKMAGVTESGRVYLLKGAQGGHPDGLYVWGLWCRRNEITDIQVVDPTKFQNLKIEDSEQTGL